MSDSNRNSAVTRRTVLKDGVAVTLAVGGLGAATAAAGGNETATGGDTTTSDDSTLSVGVVTDATAADVDGMTAPTSGVSTQGQTDTIGFYVESTDILGTVNWRWMNWTSWEYTGDELLWANSVGENREVNKLWSFVGHYLEDLEYRTNTDGVRVSALTTQVGEYDHPTDHALPWVQVYVNGAGEYGLDDYGGSYWDDTA